MKSKLIYYIWLFSLILLISSCKQRNLSAEEYIQYCNNPENKLIVQEVTDSFEYFLQYRTPEYMAILEHRSSLDKSKLRSLIEEYRGLDYYLLRIKSKYDFGKDKIDMQYMSFDFQGSIKMISLDSLTPALFQFENTQGINPYYTFSIGFDIASDSLFDRPIVIDHFRNDKAVVFNFPKDIIQSLPKLKI